MDIDLPTEIAPTEETVQALMEYLVGPLLPLRHSDEAKESPSVSQQKSVARQVHAAIILYNYCHRNHHRELEFLDFEQFCNLAMLFKPSIMQHMKYMCPFDRPIIDDPENQLSLVEKAIMDACTISKTLLDASPNVASSVNEWPITKVAVLLIDSNKENCLLRFNNGVWSIIEEEICSEDTTAGSKSIRGKKRKITSTNEHGVEEKARFLQIAFSAVEGIAGIKEADLKVLESHVVYSLNKATTAACFYIMQYTQSIDEENLVPIQDAIHCLQGPVVKKSSGTWVITPFVEYFYLLPYAGAISDWFSRVSNNLQNQVGEGNTDTNLFQSLQRSCEKESAESRRGSINPLINNSKLELEVHIYGSRKAKPCNGKDAEDRYRSNKNCTTAEPVDAVTSELIVCDNEEGTGVNATGMRTGVAKQKDSDGSCMVELNNSSKGLNNKNIQRPLECLQTENQRKSTHLPLKVYHHQRKSTPSNALIVKESMTGLNNMSSISECKGQKVDSEEKSCIVPAYQDGTLIVDHALARFQQNTEIIEKTHFTMAAKGSDLSQTALRALSRKREKLFNKLRNTEDELALCDRKIQAILDGGTEDGLDLKLEAIIDCCNEMCLQDEMQGQDCSSQHVSQGLPVSRPSSGKRLSEAQLTLRRSCQELDDICRVNNWILPRYGIISSDGGFVANVTVKGTDFECSDASDLQPSPSEARNSAAAHMIAKLQQMASKCTSSLVLQS